MAEEAKDREIASSKWLSPLVIGIFVAAIGLIGNVVVTAINNANTQELERFRTQSNLVLEAIKTNGDPNAACRNLIFFVSLGLIEDRNNTITGACPGNVQGVPSVSVGPPDSFGGQLWYPLTVQTMDDQGALIPGVMVEADLIPSVTPIQIPPEFPDAITSTTYLGTSGRDSSRCTSGRDGHCYLAMAPSRRFIAILAKKEGYAGNRTNIFFTGTSVVVVLQKAH